MAAVRLASASPTFLVPFLQMSTSARGRQTAREAAASTAWARTTASARKATCWSEEGGAKVSLNLHLGPLNLISSCALFVRCRHFWTLLHQCCRQVFGRLVHRSLEKRSLLPLSWGSACVRHRRQRVFVCLADVDECAADRNLCQPYGTCENRPGSYSCECNHGYTLSEDKRSCEGEPAQFRAERSTFLQMRSFTALCPL